MGACCGSKQEAKVPDYPFAFPPLLIPPYCLSKSVLFSLKYEVCDSSTPQPTNQRPISQPVPTPPIQTAALIVYKPFPNERKLMCYNTRDKIAFELPVSIPFRFKPNCGVVVSSKTNKMHMVGGFSGKTFLSAQSDDFTDECLSLELNYLTGRKNQYPAKVGFMTLLLNDGNLGEEIYSVGGCQFAGGSDDLLEQGTFAVLRPNTTQWEILPALRGQKYCCPASLILNGCIYCVGGFQHTDGRLDGKDSIMMYRIQSNTWNPVQFKSSQFYSGLAARLSQQEFLIFNATQPSGKEQTFTLTESKLLNSQIPDCPEDDIWYPIYYTEDQFSVISEKFWMFTFDNASKKWTGLNMLELVKPLDLTKLPGTVLRTPKYYAFHVDWSNSCVAGYNTVSNYEGETIYSQKKFCEDAGICVLAETSEILMIGGRDGTTGQLSRNCLAILPGINQVRSFASLPQPQQGIRMVILNNQLYAMAGFNDSASFSQVFDNSTFQWTPLPPVPQPTKYPVCFHLNKNIYMIGGEKISENDTPCGDVQAMNVESKVWTKLQVVYPLEMYKSSAIDHQKSGSVLIFGGDSRKDEPVNTCYLFNGQQFRPAPKLETSVELLFEDPPCHRGDDVYIYNRHGDLFRLNLETLTWNDIDADEQTEDNRV